MKYLNRIKAFVELVSFYTQLVAFYIFSGLREVYYIGVLHYGSADIPPIEFSPRSIFNSTSTLDAPITGPLNQVTYTFTSLESADSLGSMVIVADEWGKVSDAYYKGISGVLPMVVQEGAIVPSCESNMTLAENNAILTIFDRPNNEAAKFLQLSCNAVMLQLDLLIIPSIENAFVIVKR